MTTPEHTALSWFNAETSLLENSGMVANQLSEFTYEWPAVGEGAPSGHSRSFLPL